MLLGLDLGSSSVKAVLVDPATGAQVASVTVPDNEMTIQSPRSGWAEQDPQMWMQHVVAALRLLKARQPSAFTSIQAIGIGYQMHGLVCLDDAGLPLRPAIIWCDSRAVDIGAKAFRQLGSDWCLQHLLNSPGNFTASKLCWVKENEPELFGKIRNIMLPGDYIAYRLTGEICTTDTGLTEGVFWDFSAGALSSELLAHLGISASLIPERRPVFSEQGKVSSAAADLTGLREGIPVSYRAGDQPNNAFSLNVLHPGETAATAGTSGVIYSVTEKNSFDPQSRVNTFLHVNHTEDLTRNGILLCINGTGSLNSWLRRWFSGDSPRTYDEMNARASNSPIGADGLSFLPFGNGAERILGNKNPGATMLGLDFNRHTEAHVLRAAQEGIVYAMAYGFHILNGMGATTRVVRAGRANMFLSPIFREAFVNTLQVPLELYDTNGAVGAALGAGVGAGVFHSFPEAFSNLERLDTIEPEPRIIPEYRDAYLRWSSRLVD